MLHRKEEGGSGGLPKKRGGCPVRWFIVKPAGLTDKEAVGFRASVFRGLGGLGLEGSGLLGFEGLGFEGLGFRVLRLKPCIITCQNAAV